MLDKTLQPLIESGIINEDTKVALTEAWESRLMEARQEIRAELREEFAQKHEHDKQQMVDALDRMVTESLTAELQEFQQEKRALHEDRVRTKRQLVEHASNFNDFMVTKLAEEITELRSDRQRAMENQQKLENFIVHALAREVREFAQDKQAVVEAKVKLVTEGKRQLEELKQQFIAESSTRLSQAVAGQLVTELRQLKEDIKIARENNFGRRLFEAFAGEFSVTHLNERAETRKLLKQIATRDEQLQEAHALIAKAEKLVEHKEREVRIIKESNVRERVMSELLGTLNEDRASTMKSLLESVQTSKLKNAFDKYLPSVLNSGERSAAVVVGNSSGSSPAAKQQLVESRRTEVTGNKSAEPRAATVDPEYKDNVVDLKRLAGL